MAIKFGEYTIFEYFTSGNALNEWLKRSTGVRTKIEVFQHHFLTTDWELIMTKDSQMIGERDNNKNVTNEKFILVVLRAKGIILRVGYKTIEPDLTHDNV